MFAIAITLPVVQLTAPKVGAGENLGAAYARLRPDLIAYILGFMVIGLFWNCSHFGAKLLVKSDQGFNLLTLLFLASVTLTPFPARPFIEHIADPPNAGVAAMFYGLALTAPIAMWFSRWLWGVLRGLYNPELPKSYVRALTIRYATALAVALSGALILVLTKHPRIGLSTVAASTASFLLPPTTLFGSRRSLKRANHDVSKSARYAGALDSLHLPQTWPGPNFEQKQRRSCKQSAWANVFTIP
ncbi:hypothetical protein ACPOL_6603 [Acidisarcina polymorpha]|uniref:DUF1211 domain-containing protein n=1 Tax=Acidisarcina polymorpha TaxID=2211140 RepID=A0A2Z5GB10_9BACT|nr:hypothetical protein ACPOL_6603 [Acidisarcina polymorpha]